MWLTLVDVDTVNERISVFDHSYIWYSTSYQVLSVEGDINSKLNVTSTRGGLVVYYEDFSLGVHGRGILFEVQIDGM